MNAHEHQWLTVDATPTTSKRYVLYDFCGYCHEMTDSYDGGRIPLRRRLAAWWKHGSPQPWNDKAPSYILWRLLRAARKNAA